MITPLKQIAGVPDGLIVAINDRLRQVNAGGASPVHAPTREHGGAPAPAAIAAAPNVASATVAVTFASNGHDQTVIFSGSFLLPIGDPNYGEDQRVDVIAVDPAGNTTLVSSLTGTPVGSPGAFSGPVGPQPAGASQTWSCRFVCYNELGTPTPAPYTVTGIVVLGAAAGLTAVSGAEVGPVYQDPLNQGLHTVVALTPAFAPLPGYVTFWLDFDDGTGWHNQGPFPFTTAGQSIHLGQPIASSAGVTGSGSIWVPTDPTHGNWQVAACAGDVTGSTPPAGYVSAGFTVAVAQACLPTDCTQIQFIPNPVSGDLVDYILTGNGQYQWTFDLLEWLQPTAAYDPYYQYSMVTVQKGYASSSTCTISGGTALHDPAAAFTALYVGFVIHVAGVWNTVATYVDATHLTLTTAAANGSAIAYELWIQAPDWEGVNGESDLLWYGRGPIGNSGDPGGGPEMLGSTVQLLGPNTLGEAYFPPDNNPDGSTNLHRTYRFLVYAVSRLGQNPNGGDPTGTYTLQTGWPGGADHGDLTIAAQPSALDLSKATAASAGKGLKVLTGALQVANGYTIGFDGSGNLVFLNLQVVSGLPTLPNVLYPAGSTVLNSVDSKIYRTLTGLVGSWIKSTDPQDLAAGALYSGVTLNAAQVNTGTFNGLQLILNLNGVTTSITNQLSSPYSFVGFKCLNNTTATYTYAGSAGLGAADPTGGSQAGLSATSGTAQILMESGSDAIVATVTAASSALTVQGGSAAAQIVVTVGGVTTVTLPGLPSSSPGAGTKQLWYDPADSNRVKYAP